MWFHFDMRNLCHIVCESCSKTKIINSIALEIGFQLWFTHSICIRSYTHLHWNRIVIRFKYWKWNRKLIEIDSENVDDFFFFLRCDDSVAIQLYWCALSHRLDERILIAILFFFHLILIYVHRSACVYKWNTCTDPRRICTCIFFYIWNDLFGIRLVSIAFYFISLEFFFIVEHKIRCVDFVGFLVLFLLLLPFINTQSIQQ